ncbi:universal stress protein [Haloarcula marina]|uniref:universal stress protein n=1 Tax=Haloarcula marina TaxID=2961574 RepID=UPI0021146F47|nr:universal stress protein [Halomicroarcula marina]
MTNTESRPRDSICDRIVLPTDGSEDAMAAVRATISFADRFGAALHVIHVVEFGELPPGVHDPETDEFSERGNDAVSTVTEMGAVISV